MAPDYRESTQDDFAPGRQIRRAAVKERSIRSVRIRMAAFALVMSGIIIGREDISE